MTEVLTAIINRDRWRDSAPKKGTVGFAMKKVETKVLSDGELYFKTPSMFK